MLRIKEMDESYILDDCPLYMPLDPERLARRELPEHFDIERAKQMRRRFFREIRQKYGNCVLFAWDDGKIVGFLIFLPKTVARRLGLKTLHDDELTTKTMVYVCMQLVEEYRKRGMGTRLVESLIAWARNRGWRRIEVHDVQKGDEDEDWRWKWALPKWHRTGFRIARRYVSRDTYSERKVQLHSLVLDMTDS